MRQTLKVTYIQTPFKIIRAAEAHCIQTFFVYLTIWLVIGLV